ncbi:hypothetical protein [Alcaligenes aquatilis]|uniref:hypothetical protein n=1 Tax=Alcaligenes aquatilis TaxID=323284 RepID=UPI00361869BB
MRKLKKTRVYEVTIKDGHGEYTHSRAGQSKAAVGLDESGRISHAEKLLKVKYAGYFSVQAMPDDEAEKTGIQFQLNRAAGNQELTVTERDPGFGMLTALDSTGVAEVQDFMRRRDQDPDE